jgi:hypothetical protein
MAIQQLAQQAIQGDVVAATQLQLIQQAPAQNVQQMLEEQIRRLRQMMPSLNPFVFRQAAAI